MTKREIEIATQCQQSLTNLFVAATCEKCGKTSDRLTLRLGERICDVCWAAEPVANDATASDTPRSDDIRIGADQTAIVQLFKHARQLERELNEAKETIATWITSDKRSAELSTLRREKAELWAALEEMHKCFFDPAENESKPGTWGAAACDKATAILAATKEKEEGK